MFWLGILKRLAIGDGGGVVNMPLFRAWFCGLYIGYAMDGGVS